MIRLRHGLSHCLVNKPKEDLMAVNKACFQKSLIYKVYGKYG